MKINIQSGDGHQTTYTQPQFSPDGSMISFLRSQGQNRGGLQIYIYHTATSQVAVDVFGMVTGRAWDLAPTSFRFSTDGHSLYITAEDCGQVGLYLLHLQPHAYPVPLLQNGTVSAYYPLRRSDDSGEAVLVTSSSFVESCLYQLISDNDTVATLSSSSDHGAKLGLSPKQISEMYFEGGGDYIVHAWVVKPRYFDEGRNYPLAILVHDGAGCGAWLNAWDTKVGTKSFNKKGPKEPDLMRELVERRRLGRARIRRGSSEYHGEYWVWARLRDRFV